MTTKSSTSTNSNKKSQRVTLFLKPEILKQARAQAVIEEITLTQLVTNALIAHLPLVTIIKKVVL
ncbi:hypothetical protein A3K29_02420 [Candidatus Collierbacteria bacterium RIFOXYB2_FULL_46_14]|uniref:Uncharacterized protein n=1 Tax=Candidatus Collierbacteria bacterium GW2011_GWA2_46_26 TaxID=1618381 RepID=A0A0G1SGM8_9BACT|nr:MAG: hypothetical protein UW29_C0010G0011 [Candidatus Collierbacteria bacterium GW2011_GWC2_44_13]KKU32495.1 MAG: hypothetical protein UX47_C0010G0011 [Candidatus Collierbacteria bacterium GW2011_GWA2_46_26]OGD72975.1 MAG: hypothetical protein A3K29_02420 [Candidatus Collierbacteria bacterium RIFOXYB2_FULL_46_14]OGD76017.1 MAG: hypothetical protein A3K43_02420 [Candidatus Collierbacteria bacterium RIFOXYA2_FULL_46_20]OGD77353.1 MAG: hypothetical protein A3K39_02420 [Candidatus Collierbacteri